MIYPNKNKGSIFLVPSPIDDAANGDMSLQLPKGVLKIACSLQYWLVENAKTARAHLKRMYAACGMPIHFPDLHLQELPHAWHKSGDLGQTIPHDWFEPAFNGHDIGIMSEAGMPAIADPGTGIVRTAHDLGLKIEPLVGPCSLFLALAASGLSGQNFAFVGYLPQDTGTRITRIRELEKIALQTRQTQIFIETPYRNSKLLEELLAHLQPKTRLAISESLATASPKTQSHTVATWRVQKTTLMTTRLPCVFAIGI